MLIQPRLPGGVQRTKRVRSVPTVREDEDKPEDEKL